MCTLMRLDRLQPVWRRKFVHATHHKHTIAVLPNVLRLQFEQALHYQVCAFDIPWVGTHSGWLCGGSAKLALALDCWMGGGCSHADNAGVCCVADRDRSKKSCFWTARASEHGRAKRQHPISGATVQAWISGQHEPKGQLLVKLQNKRRYGTLIPESESESESKARAGLAEGLSKSCSSNKRCC